MRITYKKFIAKARIVHVSRQILSVRQVVSDSQLFTERAQRVKGDWVCLLLVALACKNGDISSFEKHFVFLSQSNCGSYTKKQTPQYCWRKIILSLAAILSMVLSGQNTKQFLTMLKGLLYAISMEN